MKARINFTVGDYEDSIILQGATADEIRLQAEAELSKRGGTDPWSEIISEE